jgi:hypothetical protein
MKKSLRNIFYLILTILISSCNCYNVDCSSETDFRFKLIDKDSKKDFIYDLDVPLSELTFKSVATGSEIEIRKEESTKSISSIIYSPEKDFELHYNGIVTLLSFDINSVKGDCCFTFEILKVNTTVTVNYDELNKIFIFEL